MTLNPSNSSNLEQLALKGLIPKPDQRRATGAHANLNVQFLHRLPCYIETVTRNQLVLTKR